MNQDIEPNPYASHPISQQSLTAQQSRESYFGLESKLRSAGAIFFFPSIFGLFGGSILIVIGILMLQMKNQPTGRGVLVIGLGIAIGGIAYYLFVICERLRSLSPKARKPAIVISTVGLLGFPFGTLASVYMLSLLLGERGRFVFSEQYQTLRAKTPELKYRQTGVDWLKAIALSCCFCSGFIVPMELIHWFLFVR